MNGFFDEITIRTDREAQLIKSINSHLYHRLYCLIEMKWRIKFMECKRCLFCSILQVSKFLTDVWNVKRMIQRYEFSENSKLKISISSLWNPRIYKRRCTFVHLNIFHKKATIINSLPICEKLFLWAINQ